MTFLAKPFVLSKVSPAFAAQGVSKKQMQPFKVEV